MDGEDDLPLEEYVKLPTTVDFQVINTPRFREYAKDKPYLHFGTEFANNYIIVYTNENIYRGFFLIWEVIFYRFTLRSCRLLTASATTGAASHRY